MHIKRIGFLSVFNFGHNIGGVENHIYFLSTEISKHNEFELFIFQPTFDNLIQKNKINNTEIIPIKLEKNLIVNIIEYLNKFSGVKFLGFAIGFLNKAKYCIYYKEISNNILKYKIDLIHQHDFISNIFTTKHITKMGIKCILTNHTGEYLFFKKTFIGKIILKYLISHYSAIIGPSTELTPKEFSIKTITISNGVDLDRFKPTNDIEKSDLRKKINLNNNDFVVFCPRRWAPTKGIEFLAKSMIDYKYPNNFVFVFAGNDYKDYPKYAKKVHGILKNSKNRYIKLGNLSIEEMVKTYKLSDIVIIPSIMEAISLAALEAMACGCVVVASNVGGLKEIIENNKNGILINPYNLQEIYNSILNIYKNKKLYQEIKANGYEMVKNFSWQNVYQITKKIYIECIDNCK